jgi:hypothetical protein
VGNNGFHPQHPTTLTGVGTITPVHVHVCTIVTVLHD